MKRRVNPDPHIITRMRLGERVRKLREAKRLSQASLAALCELHVNHIGRIERSEADPTIETLAAVAKGLGMTLRDLLTRIPVTDASGRVQEAPELRRTKPAVSARMTKAS